MRRTLQMMAVGFSLAAASGCADSSQLVNPERSPAAAQPSASIQDAAHGGAAGFYFLAPLVSEPHDTAALDTSRSNSIRVDVCQLGADPSVQTCQKPAITVSATSPVFIDLNGNHYQVNWQTDDVTFPPNMYYRVSVVDNSTGTPWGHVDVYLGATGQGFHSINTADFTPLLDGRTVPIKFRIDNGATPSGGSGGGGGGVPS
jgi:hypothetical protein